MLISMENNAGLSLTRIRLQLPDLELAILGIAQAIVLSGSVTPELTKAYEETLCLFKKLKEEVA